MKRRIAGISSSVFLACATLLVFGAHHVAASVDEKPGPASIVIDNFSFTPNEVSIPKGTTVTWVNHDDVPHTVVSKDQKFRSKALDTNDQFTFTFANEGTYIYFCSVHPVMIGKIIVK